MSDTVVQVENIWKEYRLGTISHRTLSHDLQSWWAQLLGKDDPNSQIGTALSQVNSCKSQLDDRFWALQDICLNVRQGDTLGIIGRNGAGKSTLLKILSQVTAPTKGEVRYKGRIASLLEVGTGFHPELTGRENIFLNGAILGMSKVDIRKKLDDIVAFAEVEKFIDSPVKRYSSGMYVRLAFAVAAHLEPDILIVDEVLAVGDVQFQKKCLGKMEDVATKEGRTILFVSHNMQAINQLCDRSIYLDKGKIIKEGKSIEVIDYYLEEMTSNKGIANLADLVDNLPIDSTIKYTNIILKQGNQSVIDTVENGKPLEIEIKYQILEKATGIRLYIDLIDDNGTLLFRSFNDCDSDDISILDVGAYISTVSIPSFLLAPIKYNLKIYSTIFCMRHCEPSEGISIPLMVINTGRVDRAYLGPVRGKLQPLLPWTNYRV